MVSAVFKTIALFLFWLLLSGSLKPFYVVLGFSSALIVTCLNGPHSSLSTRKLLLAAAGSFYYGAWVLYRIGAASCHVAKLALHPAMPIAPRFISHTTRLQTDAEKVLFAHSITLTPGTITADMDGQELVVHQLDDASARDILSRAIENKIARIYSSFKGKG